MLSDIIFQWSKRWALFEYKSRPFTSFRNAHCIFHIYSVSFMSLFDATETWIKSIRLCAYTFYYNQCSLDVFAYLLTVCFVVRGKISRMSLNQHSLYVGVVEESPPPLLTWEQSATHDVVSREINPSKSFDLLRGSNLWPLAPRARRLTARPPELTICYSVSICLYYAFSILMKIKLCVLVKLAFAELMSKHLIEHHQYSVLWFITCDTRVKNSPLYLTR